MEVYIGMSKVGWVTGGGDVYGSIAKIGSVTSSGDVYKGTVKIGWITSSGDIYQGGDSVPYLGRVGWITKSGDIYSNRFLSKMGFVTGAANNINLAGGAALLLALASLPSSLPSKSTLRMSQSLMRRSPHAAASLE